MAAQTEEDKICDEIGTIFRHVESFEPTDEVLRRLVELVEQAGRHKERGLQARQAAQQATKARRAAQKEYLGSLQEQTHQMIAADHLRVLRKIRDYMRRYLGSLQEQAGEQGGAGGGGAGGGAGAPGAGGGVAARFKPLF